MASLLSRLILQQNPGISIEDAIGLLYQGKNVNATTKDEQLREKIATSWNGLDPIEKMEWNKKGGRDAFIQSETKRITGKDTSPSSPTMTSSQLQRYADERKISVDEARKRAAQQGITVQ